MSKLTVSKLNVEALTQAARDAANTLSAATSETKDSVLLDLAGRLRAEAPVIIEANRRDISLAEANGLGGAKLKRLALDETTIEQMATGLEQIAGFTDPVGQVTTSRTVDSGLKIERLRTPIGVIMMIYEARPNVTVDAFALCFKAGNACILKGGREAQKSNEALAQLISASLEKAGLPATCLSLVTSSDREVMRSLLGQHEHIDLVIPRGGEALIRFVHKNSTIPTVQHFHGVCHVFIDESAVPGQAIDICLNGKTSATAACNATEAILVHRNMVDVVLPDLLAKFQEAGVEVRGDATVQSLSGKVVAATKHDWGREFLDMIIAIKVVDGLDEAIEHIHRYGSNHTEVIVSQNEKHQQEFCRRVQASCTLVNASTRFNDGFELGLGAEIGISTSRVHAYGPMGLEELTVQRFVVHGDGQIR